MEPIDQIEPGRPLSVKVVTGGVAGETVWIDAVSELDRSLRSAPVAEPVPFLLTVTFVVPGRAQPKLQGLRVGFYLSNSRTLSMQIVLPKSPPSGDAGVELLGLLRQAVDRAEAWGRRRGLLDGELTAVRSALVQVSADR